MQVVNAAAKAKEGWAQAEEIASRETFDASVEARTTAQVQSCPEFKHCISE